MVQVTKLIVLGTLGSSVRSRSARCVNPDETQKVKLRGWESESGTERARFWRAA